MKKVISWLLAALMAVSLVTALGCAKKEEPKEEPKVQEETKKAPQEEAKKEEVVFVSSADKPEACASCHVNDSSLNAMIKKIEKHPQVQANTVTECGACHQKDGYPPLNKVIHKSHYQGEDNAFASNFKGSCVHCHKLTVEGQLLIPGLAPAGTKYDNIEVAQIDKSPNGCLDCHKNNFSISNMVKKISGHPPVDFADFNQCYSCHGTIAPGLGKALHPRHLKSDAYKNNYGNSCQNCHKMMDDNSVTVKGKK